MSLFSAGKAFIDNHPKFLRTIAWIYTRLSFNRFSVSRGNSVSFSGSFLKRCRIKVSGKGNQIIIHPKAVLRKCTITLTGHGNRVIIGERVYLSKVGIVTEDDSNTVEIGAETRVFGPVHMACIEGTTISIGKDCLLSSEIHMRTGDSHSVVDLRGNRTNASKDIYIADHVWVGYRSVLTKGARVESNSIVSLGAIVTKAFDQTNVVLGGVPARIVKTNVNWCKQRIKENDRSN